MKTLRLMFVVIVMGAIALEAPRVRAQTSDNPAARVAVQQRAEHAKLFLRGAKLWPVYCNACHNARPASDFSPAEWKMIMMHMRTQANLPPEDAKAILVYLQQR